MAVTNTPIYPQTITGNYIAWVPGDAQALRTLYTGNTNGSWVSSILLGSTDTTSRDFQISIVSGGTTVYIGTISCLLNSGFTNAVPSIQALRHAQIPGLLLDPQGNPGIYLASGAVLQANILTTITANKTITAYVQAGDFPALAAQGRYEWLEFNGQTITDGSSPCVGQVWPNINTGTPRFLRGGSTSGSTGGCDTCCATVTSFCQSFCPGGSGVSFVCAVSGTTGSFSTIPAYYQVVWIGRYK